MLIGWDVLLLHIIASLHRCLLCVDDMFMDDGDDDIFLSDALNTERSVSLMSDTNFLYYIRVT